MTAPTVQTQKRREDIRLLTGAGRYTTDLQPEGLLHLAFVRSPHAHATIARIDASAAEAAEGVVAVITGAELAAAGIKPYPGGFRENRPDGAPAPKTDRQSIVVERVRFLGEAVAAVVAKTRAEAIAGAELVEVEYDDLPAAIGFDALEPGAPALWDEAPDNIAFFWQGGDAAEIVDRPTGLAGDISADIGMQQHAQGDHLVVGVEADLGC
jgi:aerobic carbon-monoxide dehydrogenase large subunit